MRHKLAALGVLAVLTGGILLHTDEASAGTSPPGPPIEQTISAGGFHTCALTSGGALQCWGQNDSGQLGDGTVINRTTPTNVTGLGAGVAAVSAGGHHTCVLTSVGGVKCWGRNANGQLGDGTTTDQVLPVDVAGLTSGVSAVSAGGYHTCALLTSGGLKCWGRNDRGQLGDGSAIQRSTPVDVFGLSSGISAVAAGGSDAQGGHTCAVTSGGAAKCWGRNDFGQVGDGSSADRFIPADVFGIGSGANATGAGRYHSCAQMTSGGVKCWGWDIFGQLGNGSAGAGLTAVDVVDLANASGLSVGGMHTCARTSVGGAKCWGNNGAGQIGDGSAGNARPGPVNVLASPGGAALSGVLAVVAGGNVWPDGHSCALTSTGLKCWGLNGSGQVGDGTTSNRSIPVDVFGFAVTPTPMPTDTPTHTPTSTHTSTPTPTPSPTDTPVPPTATLSPTQTSVPPTLTPTSTPTLIPATATPTWTTTPTRTPSPDPDWKRCADVDGNGRVTGHDLALILRAVLRRSHQQHWDVNYDGRVNWNDVWTAVKQLGRECYRIGPVPPTPTRTPTPTAIRPKTPKPTKTAASPTATRTPAHSTKTATPTIPLD